MKRVIYIFFVIVIIGISCFSPDNKQLIIGKWKCFKIEHHKFNLGNQVEKGDYTLNFYDNSHLDYYYGSNLIDSKIFYFIRNDTLLIGNQFYIIQKLNTESMIYKQLSTEQIHYLKKIKNGK